MLIYSDVNKQDCVIVLNLVADNIGKRLFFSLSVIKFADMKHPFQIVLWHKLKQNNKTLQHAVTCHDT